MNGFFDFREHPGNLFVIATLLPLLSFLILLLWGGLRSYLRKFYDPEVNNFAGSLYTGLGGPNPGKVGACIATAAIFLSFCLCAAGFYLFLSDFAVSEPEQPEHAVRGEMPRSHHEREEAFEKRWNANITWAALSQKMLNLEQPHKVTEDPDRASVLRVGYHIDHLSAIMFMMVTFIATLIHMFSIGYMTEELGDVEDHEVHTAHGHLHRRGRYTRFFMFLSLFCFSMLNLILASNLFQIFISWELVGLCSYLLIGFYFERTSASNAANKAFITNRVGDAGFIIGMLILWTYVGTFNFNDIFQRIRSPEQGAAGVLELGGHIVRAEIVGKGNAADEVKLRVSEPGDGITLATQAIIFPRELPAAFQGAGPGGKTEIEASINPNPQEYGVMPYWMLVLAGLGIFLGCVGKSAQFPLHVWLPDAMEGPTPVSALIHAATMVAAGVYLVGRAYPLFTPEVLMVIAYTGAITLFVAATIAVVMTDIKKVLAYSTVSQLGYMMLALGLGGWVAGLFHLITHAFFKALLFLCSGSVIYGCHHVQEITRMGGLFPKMKITAITMLIGTLTIAGIPLLSGWYSKDAIIAQGFGFGVVHPEHFLLTLLPLATAGITTFYMFRMWFMTFAGQPRDEHVYEHAHESPWVMTVPLMVLAFFSVTVAWGVPIWSAKSSWLESQIHHAQPVSVLAEFGRVPESHDPVTNIPFMEEQYNIRFQAEKYHDISGLIALGVVLVGFVFAFAIYQLRLLDPAEAREQFAGVYAFLAQKWHFDELYSAMLVRPALVVAGWCRAFDLNVIDGLIHLTAWVTVWLSWVDGLFDRYVIDGLANGISTVSQGIGNRLRQVQTGYLRSYVLFLVLAAVALWILLALLTGALTAAG